MEISKRERVLLSTIAVLIVSNMYLFYQVYSDRNRVLYPEEIDKIFIEDDVETMQIVVHVTGQVKKKGIVQLKQGCRIIDAIKAAGGATEEADLDRVNLARVLNDGEKIYIPAHGENIQEVQSQDYNIIDDGRININTAGAAELETLPGIGKVLAQRIVEFREKAGSFKTPDDIMRVSGIGPKIYEEIKDRIKVR
jgi:competence protein ComEA